jgi:hypothetical protein
MIRVTEVRDRPNDRPIAAAVAAYLAGHPYASATELAEVRAAAHGKDPHQVPYLDLTVSAVKSVSVLHASYPGSRPARPASAATRTARPRWTRPRMRSRPRWWNRHVKPWPGWSSTLHPPRRRRRRLSGSGRDYQP